MTTQDLTNHRTIIGTIWMINRLRHIAFAMTAVLVVPAFAFAQLEAPSVAVPARTAHRNAIHSLQGEPGANVFVAANQLQPNGNQSGETKIGDIPAYPQSAPVGIVCPGGHCPDTAGPLPGGLWPAPIDGVHCDINGNCGEARWKAMGPIPFDVFAQGEYIGPARLPHVKQYRLRVDDQLDFVFRIDAQPSSKPYLLEVGDTVKVESLTAPELNRDVSVEPDGTVTLLQLGQVPAANRSAAKLAKHLDEAYKKFVKNPSITVTPVKFNTRLEELRATVDTRGGGRGGQFREVRVTPEGTIALPAIGNVYVQGLSLDEVDREVEARYAKVVSGLQVTPILQTRAPRFIYVLGEVATPGRFELVGPTTLMQSIALAGSWNVGANLNHVVVFRRDENWRLMATRLDIRGAVQGKQPCPADEIWLRDSDIVVVPKSPILVADDFIELVFTRGIYGVFPIDFGMNFARLKTI